MKKLICLLLISFSLAGYIPEHIIFSKWCDDVTQEIVKTGNPIIDTTARYASMMASHVVTDVFIGEHQQGAYHEELTVVNALTMLFATPEEQRVAWFENFFFGWFVPDILLKKEFHSHGIKPIFQMTQDQSILFSNVCVMFYTVEVNFNVPFVDVEVNL